MNPRTTARDLDRVLNGLAKQAAAIDDPVAGVAP
jgi:hypothetical protein